MSIKDIFFDNADFSLLQSIFIGLFFLIVGLGMYIVMWYMNREALIEIAFPKTKRKMINKFIKRHSLMQKITLLYIIREGKEKRAALWFYWMFNVANILCACISLVSCIAVVITKGVGWAMLGALFLPFELFLIRAAITFFSDLIFLKSERSRYSFKSK